MNLSLWGIALIVFLMNVPFGYWRENTMRFSYQWFLSIHIPVPIIIAFRVFAGIGWYYVTFPVLAGAFFLGQLIGGKIHSLLVRYAGTQVSSCLFLDLVKIANTYRSGKDGAQQP